jgi:hypothetical protein
MGQIKSNKQKKPKGEEYQLGQFEEAYLKALIVNRNAAYNQYQTAIQAFLSYLGADKMGIANPETVEFSADLEKGTVTVIPKTK